MSLQECGDMTEAVPLDASLSLYLKPASKIKISVQLPKLKTPGQSISTWQVMEKLKSTIRPDQFLFLKSLKITSAVIKFLGELETRPAAERALARLQAAGGIKLSGFSEFLQIRCAHAASAGPTRHDWDSYFRDARGLDEMKPGERPDTMHLQELPIRWFSESTKNVKPSERLVEKAFSNFGRIRRLEIPANEGAKDKTFGKTSSLQQDLTFEVYIQYYEYVEFATAMDSLRGKKLLFKNDKENKVFSAEIKVDFDKTKYLSERNIKKRELEAQKTPCLPDRGQKEAVVLKPENSNCQVPVFESVESENAETEAFLLLKELLRRAEMSERTAEEKKHEDSVKMEVVNLAPKSEKKEISAHVDKIQEKLLLQEKLLKEKLLRSLKEKEQQKITKVREKLRKELSGHKLLSVLGDSNNRRSKKLKKIS